MNTERAEEERTGLVRWLRPEFQNPSGQRAVTQVGLTGVEEVGDEVAVGVTATTWPKKMPEQVTTLRDLLMRGTSPWSAAQVAAVFKGAKPRDVEPVLDSLAAVGLLLAYEGPQGRRWRPGRMVA